MVTCLTWKLYFCVFITLFLSDPISGRRNLTRRKPRCARILTKQHSLDEIYLQMDRLARNHPSLVEVRSIGTTHSNRDIKLIKITSDKKDDPLKPAIWIDGAIHSREWISSVTALNIINTLVDGYVGCAAPATKRLLDEAIFYIAPVLNPDGYAYTFRDNSTRMWRKNRRPKSCPDCCVGVDLNRNFDYDFGGSWTSENSCEDVYRGPHAFSEPETRAVRDFILPNRHAIKAFITVHCYGQMWLYPFGNQRNRYPPDLEELQDLANRSVRAIEAVHGTVYSTGTTAELLFPIGGASYDWAKGVAGIKYVYGIELSPTMADGNWFEGFRLPSRHEIEKIFKDLWAGLGVVFDQVLTEFSS